MTLALFFSAVFFAGCESKPGVDPSAPKINLDKVKQTEPEDILPPQSEPPVVDDKSPADEPAKTDDPAEDKPAAKE